MLVRRLDSIQSLIYLSRSAISVCLSVMASFLLLTIATLPQARAQNRVDLDDLSIKGELLNDNRLRLSARDPHKMAERVTYRENFRPEIIDALEVPWPDPQKKGDGK